MDPLFDILLKSNIEEPRPLIENTNATDTSVDYSKKHEISVKPTRIRNRVKLGSDKYRSQLTKRISSFFAYCNEKWLETNSDALSQPRKMDETLLTSIIEKNPILSDIIEKKHTVDDYTAKCVIEAFQSSHSSFDTKQLIPYVVDLLQKTVQSDEPLKDVHPAEVINDLQVADHSLMTNDLQFNSDNFLFDNGRKFVNTDLFQHLTRSPAKHRKLKVEVMHEIRITANKVGLTEEYDVDDIAMLLSQYALSSKILRLPQVIGACAYIIGRRKGVNVLITQMANCLSIDSRSLTKYVLRVCLATGIKKFQYMSLDQFVTTTACYTLNMITRKTSPEENQAFGGNQEKAEDILYSLISSNSDAKTHTDSMDILNSLLNTASPPEQHLSSSSTKLKKPRFKKKIYVDSNKKSEFIQLVKKTIRVIDLNNTSFLSSTILQKMLQDIEIESISSYWLYIVATVLEFVGKLLNCNIPASEIIELLYLKKSTYYYYRTATLSLLSNILVAKGLLSSQKPTNIMLIIGTIDVTDMSLLIGESQNKKI